MISVLFVIASNDGCLFCWNREVLCTLRESRNLDTSMGNTFPLETSGFELARVSLFKGRGMISCRAQQTHDLPQPSALPPRDSPLCTLAEGLRDTCKPLKHCQHLSAPSLFTPLPTPSLHLGVIAGSRARHDSRAFNQYNHIASDPDYHPSPTAACPRRPAPPAVTASRYCALIYPAYRRQIIYSCEGTRP